jgi:hypothetical protein
MPSVGMVAYLSFATEILGMPGCGFLAGIISWCVDSIFGKSDFPRPIHTRSKYVINYLGNARFEVLILMLLKIEMIWDFAPC